MLHYLESMNTYYTAPAKAALWTDEKRWLRAVQGIIVPSRQLREHSRVRASTRRRLRSSSPGITRVPADRLRQPEILSANEPITLMTVGTLSRGKGQLDVVYMLAQMPMTNVRLHLIGDCAQNVSYTAEIRALVQRSRLQESVMVHGSMPQQALFELLPQGDLYLSASSYESYSMATAEAVAHGLPIVAYATGAIGGWIEDGVNGRLIALGKPEQFFQALRQLLTERHTLDQLRHNAWARTTSLAFTPGRKRIAISYRHWFAQLAIRDQQAIRRVHASARPTCVSVSGVACGWRYALDGLS